MNEPNKAVDYILKHSADYAKAKSQRVFLEEFRKSKKALLMKDALANGIEAANAQEREAYAHPEYMTLLQGLKAAVAIEEELKWRMEAAKLRFEHYKVECFTSRVEARAMS